MNEDAGTHGGDAGTDEPDVGQTATEDLPDTGEGLEMGEQMDEPTDAPSADENATGARDDDMASGHLGEPGGPEWARG